MAAHQVAIAKASLAAALLRPDPTSVPRDDISQFHTHLEETILKCSPANIQKCKFWLVQHIVPSQGRITALAKYLAALSSSFTADAPNDGPVVVARSVPVWRKRIHLLYVLNDIQHHTKHHAKDSSRHTSLASNLQPHLVALFQSASQFDKTRRPKHLRRLLDLLTIWEEEGYQSHQFIGKLRQTVEDEPEAEGQDLDKPGDGKLQATADGKEAAYVMPAMHGDANTPYYDLPAGNMMPHIVPNSSEPINPNLVKPLQFMAGPADESLANIVREFLKGVNAIYTHSENGDDEGDIDEMGQRMFVDEASGDLVATEGYYGWSVEFCERMKKRKREGLPPSARGRGRSRSRSGSGSFSPRKRRRRSYSRSDDGDGRRFASRSRSRSRGERDDSRKRQRSRSRSPRRQRRSYSHSRSRSGSRHRHHSRSTSYSPPPPPRPQSQDRPHPPHHLALAPHMSRASAAAIVTPIAQIMDPFATSNSAPPPRPEVHPATHYNHNFPLNAQGLPVPPPPPFHQGAWPPPPPSLPPGATFTPGQYPDLSTAQYPGFVPPPPPPGMSHDARGGRGQLQQFGGHLPPHHHGQGQAYGQHQPQYGAPPPPPPPPGWHGGGGDRGGSHRGRGGQGGRGGGWQYRGDRRT